MSVEFSTSDDVSFASDDDPVPEDPSVIFEVFVADASRCCQQCFRRLRAQNRFPDRAGYDHADLLSYVDAVLPDGVDWEILGTEYWTTDPVDERLEEMHPPDDSGSSSHGCGFCGAVEPHRSPSTRSRSEALEAAVGISATLTEHGVPHNTLVLFVEVSELKQDPDYAGDDFTTFRTAVERAVRASPR